MSVTAACGWTLLRSLVLTLLLLPVCRRLQTVLRQADGPGQSFRSLLLVAPFLIPPLLVGYVFANSLPILVRYPILNEVVYVVLLAFRVAPVGTLAMYFSPPTPVSPAALHCRRLAIANGASRWSKLWILSGFFVRGPMRRAAPAFALMFLLSFQEFEIASLLQITVGLRRRPVAWSVSLFEQHAKGLLLSRSLAYMIMPIVIELLVIVAVAGIMSLGRSNLRDTPRMTGDEAPPEVASRRRQRFASIWVVSGMVMMCGIPFTVSLWRLPQGLMAVVSQSTLFRALCEEILIGSGFAIVSALVAYSIAVVLWQRIGHAGTMIIALFVVLPGLLGPLVLNLAMLAVFQHEWFSAAYDTPVPQMITGTLLLIPPAVLLTAAVSAEGQRSRDASAQLLLRSPILTVRQQASQLIWLLRTSRSVRLLGILMWLAYWDLTTGAMLGPSGFTCVSVRLYNLMHYGEDEVLTAMTLLAIVIPLMGWLILLPGIRRACRRRPGI